MSTRFFTGVGGRDTPPYVLLLMTRFSRLQRRKCRTGGARGADTAFESNHSPILYLPRRGFEGKKGIYSFTPDELAFADEVLTRAFPYKLKNAFTIDAFRRNVFQVLGKCYREKDIVRSDFVLCYTKDGALSLDDYTIGVTGGTGIAINVASLYGVEVFNLQRKEHYEKALRWCKKKERQYNITFDAHTGKHHNDKGVVWNPKEYFKEVA